MGKVDSEEQTFLIFKHYLRTIYQLGILSKNTK